MYWAHGWVVQKCDAAFCQITLDTCRFPIVLPPDISFRNPKNVSKPDGIQDNNSFWFPVLCSTSAFCHCILHFTHTPLFSRSTLQRPKLFLSANGNVQLPATYKTTPRLIIDTIILTYDTIRHVYKHSKADDIASLVWRTAQKQKNKEKTKTD